MRTRRATDADAEAIAAVLGVSFAEFERLYTRAGFLATTPDATRVRARMAEGPCWVADEDGRVLGTVSAVAHPDGVHVRSMAVAPAARGRRVAHWLMAETFSLAYEARSRRLYLSTAPFLFSAIRLYESLGFRRTGEPPDELEGTPLVTMARLVERRWSPRRDLDR